MSSSSSEEPKNPPGSQSSSEEEQVEKPVEKVAEHKEEKKSSHSSHSESDDDSSDKEEQEPEPQPEPVKEKVVEATQEVSQRKKTDDKKEKETKTEKTTEKSKLDKVIQQGGVKLPYGKSVQENLKAAAKDWRSMPKILLDKIQKRTGSLTTGATDESKQLYLTFVVSWFPLMIIACGVIIGVTVQLALRGLNFIAGAACLFYLSQIMNSDDDIAKKTKIALLVSAVSPIFIVDNSGSFITDILILVSAAGTPFLIRRLMSKERSTNWKVTVVESNIAPVVVFTVANGGEGWFNAILMSVIFAGAALVSFEFFELIWNTVKDKLKGPLEPFRREIVVFGVVEIILATVILNFLYILLLPESFFETQHNIFTNIIYYAIGLGVYLGGFFLDSVGKDKKFEQFGKYYELVIYGSYALVTFFNVFYEVFYHGIFTA